MANKPRHGSPEPAAPNVTESPRHAAREETAAPVPPRDAEQRDAAVDVSHLRVTRGKRLVLPDLSVRIPYGQVTGLLGPSGGGKSTLIRSIVGVQIVESGTITVLGQPAGSPHLRKRVGYVTQAPSVYDDLSIRENIVYFARLVGRRRPTTSTGRSTRSGSATTPASGWPTCPAASCRARRSPARSWGGPRR